MAAHRHTTRVLLLLLCLCYCSCLAGSSDDTCPVCPTTCQLRISCDAYTPFAISLRWLKSAQFAGYYAAKALGFWEDECLGVSLRPATFEYNPVEVWSHPDDTRASIPHYKQYLNYVLNDERDILHVSQYMRRPGLRWWTSPVLNPERTINITGFGDLTNIVMCTVGNTNRIETNTYASLVKHNKTGCNYIPPHQDELIQCTGAEDIRFSPCNFGVEEVLDLSETNPPTHGTYGMAYDQLGQMLSTVSNGRLYKENRDFRVFSFAQDDIHSLEDGVMVNSTWLQEAHNEETLVRFLKGLNKGWIHCRENPDYCADLVSPKGKDRQLQMHQRYQMHEVNKLIWPAPGGIGIHPLEAMASEQRVALLSGLINRTVPFEQHTVDKYVLLANQRLVEEGYDVEGIYFTQPGFQRRLEFCLNDFGQPEFCTAEAAAAEKGATSKLVVILVSAFAALVVLAMAGLLILGVLRYRHSPAYQNTMMKRNPPGVLGSGTPVTIVVTDIESSTALWAAYPNEMMEAQGQHDKCLRKCLHDCYGYEVHTEGDSFTVAFHEAEDAMKWCASVQESLQSLTWPAVFSSAPVCGRHRETVAAGTPHSGICSPSYTDSKSSASSRDTSSVPGSSISSLWKTISGSMRPGRTPAQKLEDDAVLSAELFELLEARDARTRLRPSNSGRGELVYNGLRVRMGAHTAHVSDIRRHAVTNRVIYDEALVTKAKLVSETGCGGQIIMSSDTVADISDSGHVAKYAYIVHMGGHVLAPPKPPKSPTNCVFGKPTPPMHDHLVDLPPGESMDELPGEKSGFDVSDENCAELFMLLPYTLLRRIRSIDELATERQVSPGYFQAPQKESATICFTSVAGIGSLAQDYPEEAKDAVAMLCKCIRTLLAEHGGYECEEHKGDFMVAFTSAKDCVSWATATQAALLQVAWPEEILYHPSCQTWQMGSRIIFHGPRLSVGMAHGTVIKKIPNPSTGRADYFGPLLNHTARILSKAAPGQMVLDQRTWQQVRGHLPLEAVNLGEFELKGVELPVTLFQVSEAGSDAALRSFPVCLNRSPAAPCTGAAPATRRCSSHRGARTSHPKSMP